MIGRGVQSVDVSFAQPGREAVDRVRELLAVSQRVTEEVGLLRRRTGEMVGDEPQPDRARGQSDALESLALFGELGYLEDEGTPEMDWLPSANQPGQ